MNVSARVQSVGVKPTIHQQHVNSAYRYRAGVRRALRRAIGDEPRLRAGLSSREGIRRKERRLGLDVGSFVGSRYQVVGRFVVGEMGIDRGCVRSSFVPSMHIDLFSNCSP